MTSSDKKNGIVQISIWIQECLFLLVCFFYLLFQTRPVFFLESQTPVFFKGFDFLNQFLNIPGGLADWLSEFFMMLWFSNFIGALFLTICLWLVTLLTKRWIETLTEIRPIYTFHLIPAGLLLVLHNQYRFSFECYNCVDYQSGIGCIIHLLGTKTSNIPCFIGFDHLCFAVLVHRRCIFSVCRTLRAG